MSGQNQLEQVKNGYWARCRHEEELRRSRAQRELERRKLRGDLDEEIRMDITGGEDPEGNAEATAEDMDAMRQEVLRREEAVERIRRKAEKRRKRKARILRRRPSQEDEPEIENSIICRREVPAFDAADTDADFRVEF